MSRQNYDVSNHYVLVDKRLLGSICLDKQRLIVFLVVS